MEKLVYTVWSNRAGPELATVLGNALTARSEVCGLQLNVSDPDFTGGQPALHGSLERFDGTVSVWLPSRRDRGGIEAVLSGECEGFHGYAVCESRAMPSRLPAPRDDGRVNVLSQVCLLHKPAAQAYADWLTIWLESHTDIAIRHQGTIAYLQNIVQAPVTPGAPEVHGIVEECYPAAAYADLGLFFGAADDPQAMQANVAALVESSSRFLDMDALDRIFTRPYLPRAAGVGDEVRSRG